MIPSFPPPMTRMFRSGCWRNTRIGFFPGIGRFAEQFVASPAARHGVDPSAKLPDGTTIPGPADPFRSGPGALPTRQRGAFNFALLITLSFAVAGLIGALILFLNPVRYGEPTPRVEAPTPLARDAADPVLLRLEGSNTIGSALAPALVKSYMEQRLGAERVTIQADSTQHRSCIEGWLPGKATPHRIEVVATGSGFAFEALGQGRADIGMSSRAIHPAEERSLAALGPMRDRKSEHILGMDGIAVIVHPDNPVDRLSVEQVNRIFSGELNQWSEVGGRKRPIQRYARNRESGTYPSFLSLISLPSENIATDITFIVESQELSDTVAQDPDAIGFVGLPYIGRAKAVKLAAANRPAFTPTALNVYREYYPLSRRLYLYTPASPANPLVADFVDFALSEAGQAIAEKVGFVARKVEPVPADEALTWLPADAPKRYVELTKSAEAAPFTIRFKPGSAEPDNKAWHDLPRLVQLLISPQYRNRQVIVAAFGGHGDGQAATKDLSPAAITAIKAALESSGVQHVRVEDFGKALPVAADHTPEGRERNRRVELWLPR